MAKQYQNNDEETRCATTFRHQQYTFSTLPTFKGRRYLRRYRVPVGTLFPVYSVLVPSTVCYSTKYRRLPSTNYTTEKENVIINFFSQNTW